MWYISNPSIFIYFHLLEFSRETVEPLDFWFYYWFLDGVYSLIQINCNPYLRFFKKYSSAPFILNPAPFMIFDFQICKNNLCYWKIPIKLYFKAFVGLFCECILRNYSTSLHLFWPLLIPYYFSADMIPPPINVPPFDLDVRVEPFFYRHFASVWLRQLKTNKTV